VRKLLLAVALVVGTTAVASAKVESLEGANLGTYWYGPKVELEDLKGHVVMFELWGFN
jgi:hypothetical protein